MPFRVMAGTVTPTDATTAFPHVPDAAANVVPLDSGSTTVWVWQDGKVLVASPRKPSAQELNGAQPHEFKAPAATVYINERGRHVTAEFTGTLPQPNIKGARAAGSGAGSGSGATAAAPLPSWLVIPIIDNIRDRDLGPAFRGDLRAGDPKASKYTFQTSLCGLDRFLVVRTLGSLGAHSQVILIRVFKRLVCHYLEMERMPRRNGNYSLLNVLGVNLLDSARSYFESRFGIVLTGLSAAESVIPYKVRVEGTGASGMRDLLIPAAQRSHASTPHRELWIGAVGAVGPASSPLAGQQRSNSCVVGMDQALYASSSDLVAYQSWETADPKSASMKRSLDAMNPRQRKLYSSLSKGYLGTAEDLVRSQLKETLIHEIAHIFRLVPDSEEAGGTPQNGWLDPGGHCTDENCLMFASNETANGSMRSVFPTGGELFDGFRSMGDPPNKRCALFLIACDLSDIR